MRLYAASIHIIAKYPVHFVNYLGIYTMKIKNIITKTKLLEAPGNGQAAVTQAQPTLRGANQPFSMADIPSGMRDTLQNGPKSRPGFAANTNREIIKKAGEMIGDAGATAEEIVASPWYERWYKTFATGLKGAGSKGLKLIGKVALPLTVGMAMYDGYVEITSIDDNDPDRRTKIIAIVTKLVAEYGFPVVAGYLGALAGGSVGAAVGGIGAVPGAIIGDLAATAAAFIVQYQYGEDIDQAIEDLVDDILLDADAPEPADPAMQPTYDAMGNVTGEEPIPGSEPAPDTSSTAQTSPFYNDAILRNINKVGPAVADAKRSATGTYTKPYDIRPNPLVNPNTDADPVADPSALPKPKPATAKALTPAQELARQTSTKPKTATAPGAASTPSGTPPKTPNGKLPVVTPTPTVPKTPKSNLPKPPTTPTAKLPAPATQPNYDDLTFKQAFARARERARELSPGDAGQYTFTWRGNPYQTNYKGSGTASKPNEPYIPQSKQRGMMSTAPINNPYENPKRKSINEAGPKTWAGEKLVSFGEWIAKMLGRGEKIADIGATAGKVGEKIVDAAIGGKKYKYFEDFITGESYWYNVKVATDKGRKSAGMITKESDPELFAQLSKIRSAEADAAAAAAGAGKAVDDASAGVAASEKLTAKLSPAAIKALRTTPVEKWTAEQLASLGFNKSHVPLLSAARAAGIDIVATAEEMLASPWWLGWAKFTNASKYAVKGSAWFAHAKMNMVFWGWMAGAAFMDGFNRMDELDPNDPNYTRRVREIWVEEAAKVSVELLFYHGAGYLARWGLKKFGTGVKWTILSELVVAISKGAGFAIANKYATQGIGGITIQSIVEMISDAKYGSIDRSPGAGTVENSPLYKKAYKWAIDDGIEPRNAANFATMVTKEGPNSLVAAGLDNHDLPFNECVQLAYLYNKLDESTNARQTINIHNMIKFMLSESANSDVLERSAYAIQTSGILNEAGGIYGSGSKVAPKSNVVPFAKPGQAAKALKAFPAPDAANVAKLIKSPGMKPILKTVFFKVLPVLGFAMSGYEVVTKSLEGRWTDAFLNLASMGLNVAQVAGYLAGPVGAAASIADFAFNLYIFRAPIMRLYYGVILGMDLGDRTDADLEDEADTLVKAIATQLVSEIATGAANALGINEDVDNDNFMTNVTAAIAANTKGDKAGAQKALDAAKLNNPATGSDQTNQKKMLDQLAKSNPSLAVPNTNPNSTQNQTPNPNATQSNVEEAGAFSYGKKPRKGTVAYNAAEQRKRAEKNEKPIEPKDQMVGTAKVKKDKVEEAGGIGGGMSGGAIHGQSVGANAEDVLQAYNEFAAKYPAAKLLLDITPITGTATSVIDASQDFRNGKYGQAAIDMLGALPGFKIGKYLSRGLQTAIKTINRGAKLGNAINATTSYYDNSIGSAGSNSAPDTTMTASIFESPKMGDQVMLELADGRVIVAPISELRGNSMIVTLDETGHQWLDESPSHDALKIGDGTQALSSTAQFWNSMIDTLTHDTPAGWAQLFVNLQNTTGHVARTMPHQWANIWRQQHIELGDEITRGDMIAWVKEVESAIDNSGLTESSLNPAGGSKLRKMLDSKDPAMLAVWMSSRAGSKGVSVAKFTKDKAVQSGLPANHWWGKIAHLVNETADPYSMEKRYYIVRKTSSAAPVDGISGFHQKSQAEKKLATMRNPDQYMVRAIDSTKLPKDEMAESRRSGDINFSTEDISVIAGLTDLEDAKKHAIRLITRNSRRPMTAEKIKWFTHHINNSKSVRALTKMMYDMLLSGEGLSVIGTVGGMNPNSYRQTFKEDDGELDEAPIPVINTKDTRYDYFKHGRWVIMVSKEPVLMPALTGPNPKYVAKATLSDNPRKQHISVAMTQNGAIEDVASKAIDATRASLDPDDYEHYVVDFNVDFTREYMDPKTGHFFKFEKGADGQPRLISVSPEWYQKFGTEMDQLGFRRASDRTARDSTSFETPCYSFPIGKPMVKQLGLIPNMRYSVELESQDSDGNDVFIISPHSRYTGQGSRMMMRTPGFTLAATPKNKTETPPAQWVSDTPSLASAGLAEADYKGKSVPLSKPIRTSPSEGGKFKVYVKDPKTGNIKMVRFGDTTGLSIKRDDPNRRKNYRARHHCENPGPKTKANYWSCKFWASTPVSKLLKGK